jgi:hypothetical protein
MLKHPLIVCACLLGILAILFIASSFKPQDMGCIRFEAKIGLSHDFCRNLGMRAAQEKCQDVTQDPDTMGNCMRVVVPAAEANCWSYLNIEELKREYQSLCH